MELRTRGFQNQRETDEVPHTQTGLCGPRVIKCSHIDLFLFFETEPLYPVSLSNAKAISTYQKESVFIIV